MIPYNEDTDLIAHLNVCPDCGTVASGHMLDPPTICPHEYERYVPVVFIAPNWREQPEPTG